MHDPEILAVLVFRLMRCMQAMQDGREDRRRDTRRETLALFARRLDEPREGFTRDVFHDEEDLALGRDDVERGDDVRMANAPAQPRFVEEHRHELGILREMRMEPFDRDGA
jgi:hypothetical protein